VGFAITILSSFRPQSILGGLGALTIMMALAADLMLLPAIMILFVKGDRGQGTEVSVKGENT
jgi:predicted RND superfamily exporter protein